MLERPKWCPHPECEKLVAFDSQICSGRLPEPVPHGDGENTHRFCLNNSEDEPIDLQIHSGDAYLMGLALDAVRVDHNKRNTLEVEDTCCICGKVSCAHLGTEESEE